MNTDLGMTVHNEDLSIGLRDILTPYTDEYGNIELEFNIDFEECAIVIEASAMVWDTGKYVKLSDKACEALNDELEDELNESCLDSLQYQWERGYEDAMELKAEARMGK